MTRWASECFDDCFLATHDRFDWLIHSFIHQLQNELEVMTKYDVACLGTIHSTWYLYSIYVYGPWWRYVLPWAWRHFYFLTNNQQAPIHLNWRISNSPLTFGVKCACGRAYCRRDRSCFLFLLLLSCTESYGLRLRLNHRELLLQRLKQERRVLQTSPAHKYNH